LGKTKTRDGVRRTQKKVRWTFFPPNRPSPTSGGGDPNPCSAWVREVLRTSLCTKSGPLHNVPYYCTLNNGPLLGKAKARDGDRTRSPSKKTTMYRFYIYLLRSFKFRKRKHCCHICLFCKFKHICDFYSFLKW